VCVPLASGQLWSSDAATNSPAVQVSLKGGEFIGGLNRRQVERLFLTVGTNQFAFRMPEGFHADASNPRNIILTDTDCTCFICVRFDNSLKADPDGLHPDACRALALNWLPGARIAAEFSGFADHHSGPGFDLKWVNSGGVEQLGRITFIPLSSVIVEFSLLTSPEKLRDAQSIFRGVMSSFCTNDSGKLRIEPVSDQS
jgi:hypothetical protein